MSTTDLDVLRTARRWMQDGHPTLLITVTQTWGSSPRPIGSMMVIRGDGHVRGSVSGGCIEDDLIEQMRDNTLMPARPTATRYGLDADDAHRFGLPCGGTLALMMEPIGTSSRLDELIEALEAGRLVKRTLDLNSGAVRLDQGDDAGHAHVETDRLVTFHGPRYRLVIIGAGELSHYVALFAQALDYAIIVCDPREELLAEWQISDVECTREMPDDLLLRLKPDARTAVVTLTHDPKLDDMALLEALVSPAFYVGAIGSRRNNAQRRERLALFDIPAEQIARLRGPIGLYIGARTPSEIALAVVAEMTAMRHGVPVLQNHEMRAP